MATNDTSSNVTNDTTATPPEAADTGSGYTRYFVGTDRVLYRERDGWPGEILNGDTWEGYAIDLSDVRQITEDEARQIAGGIPLDAPSARPAAAGYDGGDAKGTETGKPSDGAEEA